jgi:RND family efflux transporter MFP subunit
MLLLAACGGQPQAAQSPAAGAPKVAPAPPVAADTARRGDIQQSLAYSGDIRAREQINVLPKAAGRVERVLVDIGSRVKAGDTLAVLEQDSAEIAVLQARATLAGAEAKLSTLKAGPRSEDVAAAEAGLNQQLTRLQNMRSGGRAEDIKAAQAGVTSAQARLQALRNGADEGVRQAQQSAVDSDQAAIASAEAAFAALGGQNASSLQQAQSQVDSLQAQIATAQATINSADAALANLTGSSAADVQQAQSAYDQARSQLGVAQAALKQNFNPTQAQIAAAEAEVERARSGRASAEAQQTALEQNAQAPCAASLLAPRNGTACAEAKAAADGAVKSADAAIQAAQGALDQLKRGGSPAQQTKAQADADQAQAQVNTAKARLEAITNGGVAAARAQAEAQKQSAQGALVQAQENMKVAQATFTAVKNGNLDAQVKSAQANLTAARERLKSDEARLEVILRGPTDEDVQQAQAGIDQAMQQLQKARQPNTSYDLLQQEHAVAQVQAMLQKAQNPFTDQDLAAAQAGVDQARAQLDLAQLGVRETTVVAPVDGIVAERLVAPGAMVSQQSPIVTLVPPALELVVNVEESQLGQIAEGQSVQLQVPAFPSQTFTGKVKSIAPTVDSKSRTAAVRVEPKDDANKLRAGMFARLSIITAAKSNALIVPKEAILNPSPSADPLIVAIDQSGQVHRTPVRLGLQSDRFVEIVSGVTEGQLVATSSLNDLSDGDIVAPQVETRTALAR